jgi:hypothetical protein
MKTEKYLTTKEQMKVQLLRHEVEMLTKAISRTATRRDKLKRKADDILSRVEK